MSSGINIRDNKFSFSDLTANLKLVDAIELGYQPNKTNSGAHSIAIGSQTGIINQGTFGIAIGYQAAQYNQQTNAIAIGYQTGQLNQGSDSIAIGEQAGQDQQKPFAIAVGTNAGQNNQGTAAIALGSNAGYSQQELYSVTIGTLSGYIHQGTASVAIGIAAGQLNQSASNIAIGNSAGQHNQGTNSIALGTAAGQHNQGTNSIAIGTAAGQTNQSANSIILNASGNVLNSSTSGLFINPIRIQDNDFVLAYNRNTSEIIKRSNVFNYVGDLKYSSRATDDDQWLICNGRSLSITEYSELFAVIGYTFGGSGANFNLPDPRSRVLGLIGQGPGLSNRTSGQNVGAETQTLTSNQIPAHNHTITDPGHRHTGFPNGSRSVSIDVFLAQSELFIIDDTGVSTTGISLGNTGEGLPHNIMQPTIFIGNLFVYAKYIDYTG